MFLAHAKMTGRLWAKLDISSNSSGSSKISAKYMESVIQRLLYQQNRKSTARTYLSVWHKFNDFLVQLDKKPKFWEDRTTLFIAYMIEKGCQSSTVKSYVSAIKKMLVNDGYEWQDKYILLSSLTKACKLKNDCVKVRRPIKCSMLETILFEVQRIYKKRFQHYLEVMYKAL